MLQHRNASLHTRHVNCMLYWVMGCVGALICVSVSTHDEAIQDHRVFVAQLEPYMPEDDEDTTKVLARELL